MKNSFHCIVTILVAVFVLFSLTGCADQTTPILEKAINDLAEQPETWKDVLNNAIAQMDGTSKSISAEINTIYHEAVVFTAEEPECNTTALGKKIQDDLINIRDANGTALPHLSTAWVCRFNPDRFELAWDAGQAKYAAKTPLILVSGFNFRTAGLPIVELRAPDDTLIRQMKIKPVFQSAFRLQLNFQDEDFSFVEPDYHFALSWGDQPDPVQLPITLNQPPAAAKVEVTFTSVKILDSEIGVDAHFGLYIYADNGGRYPLFDWNNGCKKVSPGRHYTFENTSFLFSLPTNIIIEGYTDDSDCWPGSEESRHTFNLGSGSYHVDPSSTSGPKRIGPTTGENGQDGFEINMMVAPVK